MKLKYLISLGIIISLLVILTGCPMECVAPHTIDVKVNISPQNDTIHIGDTIKLPLSFETFYTAYGKNIDISDSVINLKCYIQSFNNSDNNPFYTDTDIIYTGVENFDFILKKGISNNPDVISDSNGSFREFYYEIKDDKFEMEIEIVAKASGNYMLRLISNDHMIYSAKHCEKNFAFNYNFELSDKHKLNDFYNGMNHKNSFYAFVVAE